MIQTRTIYKDNQSNCNMVKDLLASIFIKELLIPSKCFWLVSPWISDVEILDNCIGNYTSLNLNWEKRSIRLIEVLQKMLLNRTHLVIATRDLSHNHIFLNKLKNEIQNIKMIDLLNIALDSNLHTKGLLGESFCLSGSMNITYNGISILGERIVYETRKSEIAKASLNFQNEYGGVL